MHREEIIGLLRKEYGSFVNYIENLSDHEFLNAPPQKWTPGQQLKHIYLAVRPVVLAFSLPKFLIRLLFGKANMASRSYDELVQTYRSRLANGAKASSPFIPSPIGVESKGSIIRGLKEKIEALSSKVYNFTEEELDTLRLPHPILGKITMREMLYFTIYHTGHHRAAIERGLETYKAV